mgnify:CR=1 FL=1
MEGLPKGLRESTTIERRGRIVCRLTRRRCTSKRSAQCEARYKGLTVLQDGRREAILFGRTRKPSFFGRGIPFFGRTQNLPFLDGKFPFWAKDGTLSFFFGREIPFFWL